MQYIVPMLADGDRTPVGLFSLHTSAGEVVIIFGNKSRWDQFAAAASPALRKQGQFLAAVTMEEDSIEEVADRLVGIDRTLDAAIFVPDSAPVFNDALTMFRQGA